MVCPTPGQPQPAGRETRCRRRGGSPEALRDTTPGLATRGQTHVPGPREAGAGQGVASQYRPDPERRREPLTLTARAPTLCPTPSCPHPAESQTRGTGDKGLRVLSQLSRQGFGPAPPLSPQLSPLPVPSSCGQSGTDCRVAGTRGARVQCSGRKPGGHSSAPRGRVFSGRERGARLLSGPLP